MNKLLISSVLIAGMGISAVASARKDYLEIIDAQKLRLFSINKNFYEGLVPYFEEVEKNFCEIDADLEIIKDCLDGSMMINRYLFNNPKMSEVDKAALVFHEAIYAYLRDQYGDNNFVRSRKIVGYIFSNLKNSDISKNVETNLGYIRGSSIRMEFVKIPKGSFMMGGPKKNEYQRHVTITNDFEMMKTEVTQEQYYNVTGENPSYFKNQADCPKTFKTVISPGSNEPVSLCPNNPVERVSYEDVQLFISLLNSKTDMSYRLATEAEWEYAARAGSQTDYTSGDHPDYLEEYAIFNVNSGNKTQVVAPLRSYANRPNAFGLYDMHGNVWEWVQDWYSSSPAGQVNPTGPASGVDRVIRGGSWYDDARFLRFAFRNYNSPSNRSGYVGFRLVRDLY